MSHSYKYRSCSSYNINWEGHSGDSGDGGGGVVPMTTHLSSKTFKYGRK